ncbi:MAG: hypothetical protein HFG26_00955 [Provencibacterium sp.]|jgi:rRNA maturation endonuclease Nob1|nr:hypothetical protein [Provencibacterium sp.]
MGTLDNIFNRARDVANDLGQKANDVVEVSKLKLSVVSLGSDIDKVYQKLGLMIYEMVKAGTANHELVDGCVAEIDALKIKLDEVNQKIDALKNVRRCDSCGNAVDIAAQFCPMCGSLLQKPEAEYRVVEETETAPAEEPAEEPVEAPAEAPAEAAEEPEKDETAGA